MRRCLALISVVLTSAVVAGSADAAMVTIADGGRAMTRIVIARDHPVSVQYAAEELRDYVRKMSGAELEIVTETPEDTQGEVRPGVYVGDTHAAGRLRVTTEGMGPDALRIATPADGVLILTGRDWAGPPLPGRSGRIDRGRTRDGVINTYGETGTLFAVYRLLEALGCRWFMKGEIGEVVPKLDRIVVRDLDIADAPHFQYRHLYAGYFSEDPELAKWFKRLGCGAEYYINLNHSYTDWAGKYCEDHPEYFATINGVPDCQNRKEAGRVIIDFTEPAVLEQTVADAEQFFAQPPWNVPDEIDWGKYMHYFPIFPVIPNDSFTRAGEDAERLGWVTPERGRRGTFSDYVWGFVNEVAKRAKADYPDRYIGSLAYAYQFLPPTRIQRLEDNVLVMICQQRLQRWDPERKREDREALLGWLRLKPARLYIWEYYNVRLSESFRGVPSIATRLIDEDIKFLKDYSMGEFIESESVPRSEWQHKLELTSMSHLNHYVTAKLLWNPDQRLEDILDDYYRRFYGPAEQPMREFYGLLEDNWMNPEKHSTTPWRTLFTPEDIDRLFALLDRAKALAEGTEVEPRIAFIASEFEIMREESAKERFWDEPMKLVARHGEAPVVDGKLDDPIWRELADSQQPMYENIPMKRSEMAPRFMVSWAGEALYLGVEFPRTPGTELVASVDKPDGPMWVDDSIEVFFEPTRTFGKTYHLIINSKGFVWDTSPDEGEAWNAGAVAAGDVQQDQWTLEVMIPLASLNAPPPTEEAPWLFDAMGSRYEDQAAPTWYAWSPTRERFDMPARFGHLVLEGR